MKKKIATIFTSDQYKFVENARMCVDLRESAGTYKNLREPAVIILKLITFLGCKILKLEFILEYVSLEL